MNPQRKEAISINRNLLVNSLSQYVSKLINCIYLYKTFDLTEIDLIIQTEKTKQGQLIKLFELLKQKDSGWDALIVYLYENDHGTIAATLQKSAGEPESRPAVSEHKFVQPKFQQFRSCVANYYLANSKHSTPYRTQINIDDIWLPLQLEKQMWSDLVSGEKFSYEDMLKKFKDNDRVRVTVIKGNPGSGKTGLMKKISHSWAFKLHHGLLTEDDFDLVLFVPLKLVETACDDLLQMAVSYYLNLFKRDEFDDEFQRKMVSQLKDLGSKLLVCLDGLDAYNEKNPLKLLFSEPFKPQTINGVIPDIPYKLLISTRPYVYVANSELGLDQYSVCPLNPLQLETLVKEYAQSEPGRMAVIEHMKNVGDCFKNFQFLIFMCYWADNKVGSLTLLYEKSLKKLGSLVERKDTPVNAFTATRREGMGNESATNGHLNDWQQSNVVLSTANLAFYGCEQKKRVFEEEDLTLHKVPDDAFVSGYLLHNFDYDQERVTAEFPNNSIQEYFAALHVYQQMIKGEIPKTGVVAEVIAEHNLFTRFLLGIASNNGCLPKLIEWITQPLIGLPVSSLVLAHNFVMEGISADCNVRERMFLWGRINLVIETEENRFQYLSRIKDLHDVDVFKNEGKNPDLFLVRPGTRRKAEVGYVNGFPSSDLKKKFDGVDWLKLRADSKHLKGLISRLDHFPLRVLHFSLEIDGEILYKIHFNFRFNEKTSMSLRTFLFSFSKKCLSPNWNFDQDLFSNFQIVNQDDLKLRIIFATVRPYATFPALIKSAIGLALTYSSRTINENIPALVSMDRE